MIAYIRSNLQIVNIKSILLAMSVNYASNGEKMFRPLTLVITCLFAANSFLEPTPLVEKLMNTPASMFEVGMLT